MSQLYKNKCKGNSKRKIGGARAPVATNETISPWKDAIRYYNSGMKLDYLLNNSNNHLKDHKFYKEEYERALIYLSNLGIKHNNKMSKLEIVELAEKTRIEELKASKSKRTSNTGLPRGRTLRGRTPRGRTLRSRTPRSRGRGRGRGRGRTIRNRGRGRGRGRGRSKTPKGKSSSRGSSNSNEFFTPPTSPSYEPTPLDKAIINALFKKPDTTILINLEKHGVYGRKTIIQYLFPETKKWTKRIHIRTPISINFNENLDDITWSGEITGDSKLKITKTIKLNELLKLLEFKIEKEIVDLIKKINPKFYTINFYYGDTLRSKSSFLSISLTKEGKKVMGMIKPGVDPTLETLNSTAAKKLRHIEKEEEDRLESYRRFNRRMGEDDW